MDNDKDKLIEAKKIYFMHANIHQNHSALIKESNVRQFLERDEKKMLYRSAYTSKDHDPQLMELGVTMQPQVRKTLTNTTHPSEIFN